MLTMCRQEQRLLAVASSVLVSGIVAVACTTGRFDYKLFFAAGIIIAGLFAISFFLHAGKRNGDPLLLPLAAVLLGIGLTMISRLKPELAFMQAIWAIIGLVVFAAAVAVFRRLLPSLAQYKYLCGVAGIGLLLLALVLGVDIGGHRSWIILGPVRFQPTEFAKILVVLFLSAYLDDCKEILAYATHRVGPFSLPHPRFLAPILAIWGFTMLMLVFQRDLGSALMYFSLAVLMTYIASGKASYVAMGTILFFVGSIICYKFFSHIQVRVDIWLNPWADPNGRAYQIVQSLFALGSGGIFGSGLTYGFPTLIPEVHTDFIFAAIGEELGLAGAGLVIMLYMLLIYRGFYTALTTGDSYRSLIASGLSIIFGMQVFLIIAGVTKFFPLTGITLPWVSYGGSSMVSSFIILGIIYAISEKEPGTING